MACRRRNPLSPPCPLPRRLIFGKSIRELCTARDDSSQITRYKPSDRKLQIPHPSHLLSIPPSPQPRHHPPLPPPHPSSKSANKNNPTSLLPPPPPFPNQPPSQHTPPQSPRRRPSTLTTNTPPGRAAAVASLTKEYNNPKMRFLHGCG